MFMLLSLNLKWPLIAATVLLLAAATSTAKDAVAKDREEFITNYQKGPINLSQPAKWDFQKFLDNIRRLFLKVDPKTQSETIANRRLTKPSICQRHSLYVNFTSLGMDWILYPPGYDAYYCDGDCSFPMAQHLTPTTHAVIQNFVHIKDSSLAPKPCCVPTVLNDMSVVTLDDNELPVHTYYKDMLVKECGCR